MIEIKNILCDIIDNCYNGCEMIDRYKKFYVEYVDKTLKTRHGDYCMNNHHIRIFNLYRSNSKIVATTIHELAHHIDYCNRGTTGHGKDFYAVFQQLLYTALDMGIFDSDEFMDSIMDASDSGKIRRMIDEYVPNPVEYKTETKVISCINCFNKKDLLKKRGYRYNNFNKTWDIDTTDPDQEVSFLEENQIEYEINGYGQIRFMKKRLIIAAEGSYEAKEGLKKEGFRYNSKKRWWEFEIDENDISEKYYEFMNKYPNVNFIKK